MDTEEKVEETTPVEEKPDYQKEVERLQAEKEALLKQKQEQEALLHMQAEINALRDEISRNGVRFPDQRYTKEPEMTDRDKMREKLNKLEYAINNYRPDANRRADGYSPRAPFAKDETFNGKPMIQMAAKYIKAETKEEKEAVLDELFRNPGDENNII